MLSQKLLRKRFVCYICPPDGVSGYEHCKSIEGLRPSTADDLTDIEKEAAKLVDYFSVVDRVSHFTSDDETVMIELLKDSTFYLVREHVPSCLLNSQGVWLTLLENMPYTALMRNLPKLTSLGLFNNPDTTKKVVDKLINPECIKKSRCIHLHF